jgi:MFS family permease
MTAVCGFAQSFVTLLLGRIGVGLGEAGGGPAALSIISDLYAHRRRATAVAIFSLGTPTAALLNLTVNTQITHAFGWRATLLIAAAPGLVLALVLWLCMAEPKRGAADQKAAETKAPPLMETARFIWSQKSLVHLLAGAMIAYIVLAGVSSWNFSYLVRIHNANLHEIGPYLGVGISSAGLIGLYLTGRLADFLAERDERWRCWIMAITILGSVAFGFVVFTTPDLWVAIGATAGLAACATLWLAPGFALTQSLVAVRMRGTVAAIVFLIANLVGYGIGPLAVGALSDLFAQAGAANSLQIAILCVLTANVWAAGHFVLAARRVRVDLGRTNGTEPILGH